MRKLIFLLVLLTGFTNIYAQINFVDIADCSSTIITGQSQSGLCSITLPGTGNSINFRWDSFSPTEWFYHVEGSNGGVNVVLAGGAPNPYGKPYANVFASGTSIGGSATYSGLPNNDPLISDSYRGNFSGQGDRYLGFRFINGGQTFYGWVLVNSTGQNLTVKEYAYRTTANTAINAGDRGALNTEKFNENFKPLVYPNPTNDILNIEAKLEISNLKIYTATGSLVKNIENFAGNYISLNDLQKGTYFLKINDVKVVPFIKE